MKRENRKNLLLKIPLKRTIIDYVDHLYVQEQILPGIHTISPRKTNLSKSIFKGMNIGELKMQQLIPQTYMVCVSQSVELKQPAR
jgi:hypothetical protein